MNAMVFHEVGSSGCALHSLLAGDAAYQIGCEIRWRHGYSETERDNVNYDSEMKSGGTLFSKETDVKPVNFFHRVDRCSHRHDITWVRSKSVSVTITKTDA